MGSHYIPVGKIKIDKDILDIVCPAAGYDNTPPPPEIYCPVAGYIPDPTIYHEDPIITDAPKPSDGQIRLIVTDSGSRHVQFKCQVSNTGKYVVTVMGAGDTVIETKLQNNNTVCQVFVPLLEGYVADGYTYYYIDIAPELGGNDLILFQQAVNATYDPQGGYVIAAIFNTPEILSLEKAFLNTKRIRYVEFVSNMNALTTLLEAFNAAENLEKIIFPAEMNVLITINKMCYNTLNLKEADMDYVSVDSLENMEYFMSLSGIKNFKFPKNIDSVLSLKYGFQNSKILENITLFESAENLQYIDYLFIGCENLKGKIYYPEMPNLIDFVCVNMNNFQVEEIQFLGTYDNETINSTGRQMFANCKKVKKIKFPEKLNMTNSFFNSIEGCEELEFLILPKKWWSDVNYLVSSKKFFLGFLTNPKLKEISKVEETNLDVSFVSDIPIQQCPYLKIFDQPNIKPGIVSSGSAVSCNFRPVEGVSALEYIDLDLSRDKQFNLNIQNTSVKTSSIKNILYKSTSFGSMVYSVLYFSGSPVETVLIAGKMGIKNYEMKVHVGDIPDVGAFISLRYISYEIALTVNVMLSTINTNLYHYTDDTRVKFKGTLVNAGGTGINLNDIYYVVNSQGNEFQISETKGGPPITFLSDFSNLLRMSAEIKVSAVNGNMLSVNAAYPNGNINTQNVTFFSEEIDLFIANSNGWSFL